MKILITGLGGIGQRHLRNLRALLGAGAEINAVDLRRNIPVLTDQLQVEAGTTLEEKYALHIYPDLEPALDWKPDLVFVCNPTSLHVPTALRAAQAGCALFIEKPLSHTFEQVDELIRLVETHNLKTAVGYQMRFHPCLQRLFVLLQEKKVGRILSVRAEIGEYLPGWHSYEDYRQMYASRQDQGGGVILSQIHEMDYLYWLFGLPRRVYALGGHLSSLEVDVEDTAEILMDYEMDGRSVPVSLHQDYLQHPPRRTCEVIGDKGKILVNLAALRVDVFYGSDGHAESSSFEGFQRNQMFMDELKYFLDSLRGRPVSSVSSRISYGTGQGTPGSLVSVREAAHSLRMALAAKESLAMGKVVELTRDVE